ncbi:hypothetical protein DXT99_23595 [Pontibacter diazotrophicus]|uniref:Uncharacterized protein n=1 Tax=Pontibacter diazotrophicus TaxID=1400979 RepID=A0A3D8L3A4_9BACT|nr:hypothetical protein [Pontibacter diazotrophicus]RDV11891.1 hypothetical protein DXT99_23595 [Pontibacter diazotrophicus]
MWRRRIFNWANAHQKAVVIGMFCLMVTGIVWLVARPREEQGGFDATTKLLYSGFNKEYQARPVTANVMEMMRLYGEVQAINPDSLTARDSAFLKGIDQQLNNIIHE